MIWMLYFTPGFVIRFTGTTTTTYQIIVAMTTIWATINTTVFVAKTNPTLAMNALWPHHPNANEHEQYEN
jgi:hypothetical protein